MNMYISEALLVSMTNGAGALRLANQQLKRDVETKPELRAFLESVISEREEQADVLDGFVRRAREEKDNATANARNPGAGKGT